MLSYEEFTKEFKNRIMDYLPEEVRSGLSYSTANKVNVELDAVTLRDVNATVSTGPCIYMQDIYKSYRNSGDLEMELKSVAEKLLEYMKTAPVVPDISKENLVDKIVCELINTEQNEDLLSKVPSREFEDLSVIYRGVVLQDQENIGSFIIDNNLATKLGFTEEELFELAKENTPELMPFTVKTMQEVILGMFCKDGMSKEDAEAILPPMPEDSGMLYVLSNTKGLMGANVMLFPEQFEKVSKVTGTDLYILPSSIHEIIAVGANWGDVDTLTEMVHDVNMTQVDLSERLSNQVYKYDHLTREITCISDSPYKRIDGNEEREVEKVR